MPNRSLIPGAQWDGVWGVSIAGSADNASQISILSYPPNGYIILPANKRHR